MRKVVSRILLVGFGLFMSAIAIEAILQIGALYIRSRETRAHSWVTRGALRVLALGDSNTYGLHLDDRSKAYPTVLEKIWRERFPDRLIEVINAGVPGANSSKLLNQFPSLLRTFEPDVVTIMIGANDFWTEPEPIRSNDNVDIEEPPLRWRYSRLYRLLFMIWRATQRPDLEIQFANPDGYRENRGTVRYGEASFDLGWTRRAEGGVPNWTEIQMEDCKAIAKQARAAKVIPIFLTYAYPQEVYGAASETVRDIAFHTNSPLVDLKPVFEKHCPQGDCPDLYYPSRHPTAKGHRLIAEVLFHKLAEMKGG